jgi:transposase
MVTLVAALRPDRLMAPMLLAGAMTAEIFRTYITRLLGPSLRPGDIVVIDNVPLHRTRCVREALESFAVQVPEFPAYSPDLNPIEQAISKLKAFLRKRAPRSLHSLTTEVRKGMQQFSPAECAAYLRYAGYGQTKQKTV